VPALEFPGAEAPAPDRPTLALDAFAPAFEGSPDLVAAVSTDGWLLWSNPAWTQGLGRSREELTRTRLPEVVHPHDAPALFAALQVAREGESTRSLALRLREASGQWLAHDASLGHEIAPGLCLFIARQRVDPQPLPDPTARAHADLVERHLPVGSWWFDLQRRQLSLTEGAALLFGIGSQPVLITPDDLWPLLQDRGAAELEAFLRGALEEPDDLDAVVPVPTPAGPRRLRFTTTWPLGRDGARPQCVGVVHDFSAELRPIREVEARAEAAETRAARQAALLSLAESHPSTFSELYEQYRAVGLDYTQLPHGGVYTAVGHHLSPTPPRLEPLEDPVRAELQRALNEGVPTYWSEAEGHLTDGQVLLAAPIHAQETLRGILAFFGRMPKGHQSAADLAFVTLAATALGRAIETLESTRQTNYQRNLFEGLFRQTPDGILLEDLRHRRVLMVNESLCRMLGYGRDAVAGRKSTFLYFAPEDLEAASTAPSTLKPIELRLRSALGRALPVEMVSTEIADDRAQPIAIMRHVRDISARQEAEAVKREFIAVASHELRTPLTALLGSVALLREVGVDLPDPLPELTNLATRSGERLKALVDDILDLQRLENGRAPIEGESFDLLSLATEAVALAKSLSRVFNGEFRVSGHPAPVLADPRRIHQVLANLFSNASRYAPIGSVVRVHVGADGGYATCSVVDAGPGIPDAIRGRIFEKFVRSEPTSAVNRPSGIGLGLAIAKTIAEDHEGDLEVSCPDEGGTCFTLRLPLTPDSTRPEARP